MFASAYFRRERVDTGGRDCTGPSGAGPPQTAAPPPSPAAAAAALGCGVTILRPCGFFLGKLKNTRTGLLEQRVQSPATWGLKKEICVQDSCRE